MPEAHEEPTIYTIKIEGRLCQDWARWFDPMTIRTEIDHERATITTLTGDITDQAALHGIIGLIGDVVLTLLLVERENNINPQPLPTAQGHKKQKEK